MPRFVFLSQILATIRFEVNRNFNLIRLILKQQNRTLHKYVMRFIRIEICIEIR